MAKQGLRKRWNLKTETGLILGRAQKREGRRRRRREEEKEESSQGMELWIFVWKLTLIMNSMRFGMDLWVCMMIILLKPRVFLGFYFNPKMMASKVGKRPYGTRSS